jgi:2'-deoxynucleoside 5'-phosphate N-hydrolase
MKIYFAGSIRGGRDDAELYHSLIQYLTKYGEVLTEHIGDKKLSSKGEGTLDNKYIHDRDMEWIMEADVIVGEVTQVSLGVGYELGRAVENGKKILCLYRPSEDKKLSAMIAGCREIVNREYNDLEEGKKIIDEFFKDIE